MESYVRERRYVEGSKAGTTSIDIKKRSGGIFDPYWMESALSNFYQPGPNHEHNSFQKLERGQFHLLPNVLL